MTRYEEGNVVRYTMMHLYTLITIQYIIQEAARKLVKEYGVAVIPGSFCGFPGWLRVCYSNLPPEKCRVAAKRLEEGIKDLCGGQ